MLLQDLLPVVHDHRVGADGADIDAEVEFCHAFTPWLFFAGRADEARPASVHLLPEKMGKKIRAFFSRKIFGSVPIAVLEPAGLKAEF
jgi:hypothetical protein